MYFFFLLFWYSCPLYMLTISAILDCQFCFWQIKRLYSVQTDIFIKSIFVYLWTIGQFTRYCIVYVVLNTWLFVNAQFYVVLCISHWKCIFWDLNNLIARNQHYFWKTFEKIYTIFSFTQFDSMKQIQLLKT